MNLQVRSTIKAYVETEIVQNTSSSNLSYDTNLMDEGILDSLGIFVLINFLESRFDVQIEPDEVTLDNFETVSAISQLIEAKQQVEEKSA